jgi:hypothetical protein
MCVNSGPRDQIAPLFGVRADLSRRGPDESSPALQCPARSAGFALVLERPSRKNNRIYRNTFERGLTGANATRSSLSGRLPFKEANPAINCWTTFIKDLSGTSLLVLVATPAMKRSVDAHANAFGASCEAATFRPRFTMPCTSKKASVMRKADPRSSTWTSDHAAYKF